MSQDPVDFIPFQKIGRLRRGCVVTEKIDGTNAQVHITEDGRMLAGSRTRWVTPEDDNYGFARWCAEHKDDLMKLGPGSHFGEWWGQGIQRRYGITEKRFSLFNTARWLDDAIRPACCHVVPVLFEGDFDTLAIDNCLDLLRSSGSVAAPGFAQPEGVVVYHVATRTLFKKTLEKDAEPKGRQP